LVFDRRDSTIECFNRATHTWTGVHDSIQISYEVKGILVYEESEDTKGVIKSRKSKNDRQYNNQKKKNKRKNNDSQNTTKKTKDRATWAPPKKKTTKNKTNKQNTKQNKAVVHSGDPEG
jgi:hypothetical protein